MRRRRISFEFRTLSWLLFCAWIFVPVFLVVVGYILDCITCLGLQNNIRTWRCIRIPFYCGRFCEVLPNSIKGAEPPKLDMIVDSGMKPSPKAVPRQTLCGLDPQRVCRYRQKFGYSEGEFMVVIQLSALDSRLRSNFLPDQGPVGMSRTV